MGTQVVGDFNKNLAEYFASKPLYLDEPTQKKPNTRKLVEQPWQQTKGKLWDEVTNTLCNLDFIQAKACAKMTYELIDDFNKVLLVIPDNADDVKKEEARKANIVKYTLDLKACAKGEITIEKMVIPESITPWSEEQSNNEVERIKNNPNRSDRLKDFLNFLGKESDILNNYSSIIPYFVIQHAWNFMVDGAVGKAASIASSEILERLILRTTLSRPQWNPFPQCIKTLNRHKDGVLAVSIFPDGESAISASWDKSMIIWDLKTGQAINTLRGHTDIVIAVSITPDGKRAISASRDSTCKLWDLTNGKIIKTLQGHTNSVHAVSITPDGALAISASYDKTLKLWDLTSGEIIKTLEGHTSGVFSVSITPDGKTAISGSADRTCLIWDVTSGQITKTLQGHSEAVTSVCITSDGKTAISGSADHICILWDLFSGQEINRFKEHSAVVNAVSITPDGKMAISASDDKTLKLWECNSGNAVKTLKGHRWRVKAVSITPDGKWAISGSEDQTCIIWDIISGQKDKIHFKHTSMVMDVSINPDRKTATTTSDDTLLEWDLFTGQARNSYKPHEYWKKGVITPDRKRAISLTGLISCMLWDFSSGRIINILNGHSSAPEALSIRPDGKVAISASKDKTCVLWDLSTGQAIFTLNEHKASITDVSIGPDGKTAISSSDDTQLILWDLSLGESIRALKGNRSHVMGVSISPDGKTALSASQWEGCILWDIRTGLALNTFKWSLNDDNVVWCVSITPDGKKAIAAYGSTCLLFDLQTGSIIALLVLDSPVKKIAFYSIGIILGCSSGEVLILKTGKKLLCQSPSIITIRQIWNFELNNYMQPSADCPFCGNRFSPPDEVLDMINKINERYELRPEQSPCLKLPDEVWEEPRLLSECPDCHEKIKFNPFIAGDPDVEKKKHKSRVDAKKFKEVFESAEKEFNKGNWDGAFLLYLKLLVAEQFNENYIRNNMAICKINSLTSKNEEAITNIHVLIRLLEDNKETERAYAIRNLLQEKLDSLKHKKKSWWRWN